MDRRFLTVLGVSLLFALVVSIVFYQISSRAGGGGNRTRKVETVEVVVAAQPLAVGVEIEPGNIKLARVAADRVPDGSFTKIEDVVGRAVVSNVLLGEPVNAARLAERGSGFGLASVIPAGMRAVAVRVNDVVGVAGFVLPGMRVDVLATLRPPGDAGARIATILQSVPVLSAGQQIQPDASGKAVNVPVVTLLVTPEQAEILTLAVNEGKIQLVLRNSADLALGKAPGREMAELYGQRPKAAAPPAPKAAPRPVAPAPQAVPPPAPPEEIIVIRGTARSVEKIRAGSGN